MDRHKLLAPPDEDGDPLPPELEALCERFDEELDEFFDQSHVRHQPTTDFLNKP